MFCRPSYNRPAYLAWLYAHTDAIPPVLSWIPYLSYYNYAFEALAVTETSNLNITDTVDELTFTVRIHLSGG